ncbi:hypothetical protein MTR67_044865 [Solanum verrucosum]|uniref:Late blight resistance protein n=1 Tax=Solanum verrucosum TaxID=315347 RepID=A0AAF0USY4_SOLVR|nr:hypothetical protein MTR67_044865 [Solanum verrucosum]
MLIMRSCRCNPRLPSTDCGTHHGPCWWSVVHNCNPSPNQLRKLAKSRLTDRTMVRGLCSWIETSLTQPLTQTTVDQHRPSFDPRSVGEGQQPVR